MDDVSIQSRFEPNSWSSHHSFCCSIKKRKKEKKCDVNMKKWTVEVGKTENNNSSPHPGLRLFSRQTFTSADYLVFYLTVRNSSSPLVLILCAALFISGPSASQHDIKPRNWPSFVATIKSLLLRVHRDAWCLMLSDMKRQQAPR